VISGVPEQQRNRQRIWQRSDSRASGRNAHAACSRVSSEGIRSVRSPQAPTHLPSARCV
jgi:hypothetical protein